MCFSVPGAFDERPDGPVGSSSNLHGPPPVQRAAHRLPDAESLSTPGASPLPPRHAAAGGEERSRVPLYPSRRRRQRSTRVLISGPIR